MRSRPITLSRIDVFGGRVARGHPQAEGDVLEDGHVAEERVMLEDEADPRRGPAARASWPEKNLPGSGCSSPAMIRSSVVLPDQTARAAPPARRRGRGATSSTAVNLQKLFVMFRTSMLMGAPSKWPSISRHPCLRGRRNSRGPGGQWLRLARQVACAGGGALAPLDEALDHQRDQRQRAEQRSEGEGRLVWYSP